MDVPPLAGLVPFEGGGFYPAAHAAGYNSFGPAGLYTRY